MSIDPFKSIQVDFIFKRCPVCSTEFYIPDYEAWLKSIGISEEEK